MRNRIGTYLALLLAAGLFGCSGGSGTSSTGGGTSAPTAPAASLSPGTLTFSTQNIDSTSASQPATLSNTGTASLSVTSITASGDYSESNNCPVSIAAEASCTIQVTFKPTSAGVRSGTLTVNDNASGNSQSVGLTGSGGAAIFYVAPTGDDAWSGTLAAPNSSNTDGPLATFDHARAMAQSVSKTGLSQIAVQFRAGTYFLPKTQQFTASDSGTASTEIVYENFPNESPLISGGVRVSGWTNTSGNTWKTTLPASTQYFENLFYNGVRRLRPRLGGYLGAYYRFVGPVYLTSPATNCSSVDVMGSGWECFDRFQYNQNDPIANTWQNLAPSAGNLCNQTAGNTALVGDIEVLDLEKYSAPKLRISCVDTTNHIVYLTGVAAFNANHPDAHGFLPLHRYIVENVKDALTQAGQWFLDRSTTPWTLTYLANPGENPNTDTVIIPQLSQVLVAAGLQYVTFQGLTFSHDNFTLPAAGFDGSVPIMSALSFQNAQHITINGSIISQTGGAGLDFVSCIDQTSASWCVSTSGSGTTANNLIENSAFEDLGANVIRIGISGNKSDTAANVPQFNTVQNNVVVGYGRVFPDSTGIDQGNGHDNLYTHNDISDGYHGAIHVCFCNDIGFGVMPSNNTISFNRVYNLFQGLMNDTGSLYFGVGTPSPPSTGTGNKMLNNVVHDVSDASVFDGANGQTTCAANLPCDGYGGDGLYADDFTGLVDMENNLVYRVSGNAVSFSGPRAAANQASTVKNNIFAYARGSMLNAYNPYAFNVTPPQPTFFVATNNIFYFDHTASSSPLPFYVQGGCAWAGGVTYPAYQEWSSNMYWRTDSGFGTDPQAFHAQVKADPMDNCAGIVDWTFYTFAQWQSVQSEDVQSVVQNPGFNNPAYPADDYSLPKGSPGAFTVFDPTQAGRSNPVINPPAIPATFPTQTFNPTTDF